MPISVSVKRELKTSKIEFDPAIFKECTSKEVKTWNWLPPKHKKYVVHFEKGKFIVYEIG